MENQFNIVIMEDESGGYVAFVPELPGCHTQGNTLEEVRKNVKEAIEVYLKTLSKEEKEELLKYRPEFIALQRVRAHA